MHKFKITIERVEKETYDLNLEGDDVLSTLDAARAMVKARNEVSTNGVYSVIKIETVKEST
jgi:hypothetical protein